MDVTNGDALLLAILANPDDEVLRLIYADWLEESGEVDRASLIRTQLELMHQPSGELLALEQQLLGTDDAIKQRRPDWALPMATRDQWSKDLGGWEWNCGFPEIWHCTLSFWEEHGFEILKASPVRQVVLIDREPLGSVSNPRAPTRTWFRDDPGWVHRPDDRCLLPPTLFDLLESYSLDISMFDHARTYPNRTDAQAALSQACLRLALVEAI